MTLSQKARKRDGKLFYKKGTVKRRTETLFVFKKYFLDTLPFLFSVSAGFIWMGWCICRVVGPTVQEEEKQEERNKEEKGDAYKLGHHG